MNYRKTLGGLAVTLLATNLLAGAIAGDFGGEVLSNADVIGLARAGVTPDLILSKLRSSPNSFDLSTRGMITLKENGVSDEIIRAMMAAAQSPSARPTLDQARFARELENIAGGTPDARTAGIAWVLSNRDQSLPALRQSLSDPRPETRMAALAVFARLPDRDSLPAIRNLLTDPVAGVRAAAAETLAELNDTASITAAEQAVTRQLNPMDGYARLLGYARLTQASGALGAVVSSNPGALNRIAAVWALGEIGRAGVAGRPALERALTADSDPEVRREAALAVAKYHDAASARLLQDACRSDPEVRKTTLAAMADYPESVEFLVGVMSLGADQIAADELETARASLYRLTGQDFGMDGARWSDWLAQNRSGFGTDAPAFAASPAAAPVPAYPGPAASRDPLLDIPGLLPTPARTSTPQVDLEAWSIVADSTAIPMAPIPQALGASVPPFPQQPASPGFSASPGWPAPPSGAGGGATEPPMFITAGDFDNSPIPDDPFAAPSYPTSPSGGAGFGQPTPQFRTWSSEPDRPSTPPQQASSTRPAAQPAGDSMMWNPGDAFEYFGPPASDDDSGFDAPAPGAFQEPAAPAQAFAPQPAAPTAPSAPPSGISLPLPGMAASSGDYQAPPAAPSFFDAPDSSFPMAGYDASPGFPMESAPVESAATASPFAGEAFDSFGAPSQDLLFDDTMSAIGLPESVAAAIVATDPYASGEPDAFSPPWPSADPYADAPATREDPAALLGGVPPAPVAMETESPVSSPTTQDINDDWSNIFVEPEPGQQVVGPPLFGPGSPATPAGGSVAYQAPSWTETTASPTPAPAEAPATLVVTPPYGSTATVSPQATPTASRPAPAATAPSQVDTRFITPGPDAQQEEEQPRRRSLFGRRQRQPAQQRAETTLPPDYTAPSQPPQQQQRQTVAAPAGDHFTDPSVPLPPVRPEALVTPRAGEDQPPMLGEGMFGK